ASSDGIDAAKPTSAQLLEDVRRAGVGRQIFEDKLLRAIKRAHDEGEALRAIADAANISHEQVRRILRRHDE
ncbi:MAG TPA: hypothetical protein VMU73_03265, partial [Gaiellaceae bacterium]|nr:hypothetical protein [Gaiellaceae bacterium]